MAAQAARTKGYPVATIATALNMPKDEVERNTKVSIPFEESIDRMRRGGATAKWVSFLTNKPLELIQKLYKQQESLPASVRAI